MTPPRPRRAQRGNSLLLAMIVMSALGTLGGLTVVSVQGVLKSSTNDRSQAIAMYAAESGAAVTMDFLRANRAADWSQYLNGAPPPSPPKPAFPSNAALPEATGNLISPDQNAWYSVVIHNNPDDVSGNPNIDGDHRVVIQSTGHGPQGSLAIVEWEVVLTVPELPTTPPGRGPPLTLLGWRIVF